MMLAPDQPYNANHASDMILKVFFKESKITHGQGTWKLDFRGKFRCKCTKTLEGNVFEMLEEMKNNGCEYNVHPLWREHVGEIYPTCIRSDMYLCGSSTLPYEGNVLTV